MGYLLEERLHYSPLFAFLLFKQYNNSVYSSIQHLSIYYL